MQERCPKQRYCAQRGRVPPLAHFERDSKGTSRGTLNRVPSRGTLNVVPSRGTLNRVPSRETLYQSPSGVPLFYKQRSPSPGPATAPSGPRYTRPRKPREAQGGRDRGEDRMRGKHTGALGRAAHYGWCTGALGRGAEGGFAGRNLGREISFPTPTIPARRRGAH